MTLKDKAYLWSAILLWTVSFVLTFFIPANSPYITVPDALLLLGFVPFLLQWKQSWPFIVFGVLNLMIGFVLEMTHYLPDTNLPYQVMTVKHHLAELHVPMVWIWTGFAAIAFGVLRAGKNLLKMILKKKN